MGLDIGPEASSRYSRILEDAQRILWNGPMGVFEFPQFSKGTIAVARAVASATRKGAYSMVGGGDSVAAVNQTGVADQISFISTGGGAMLEYLEGKELPGILAIEKG
jgi:phosphoglycerate kinase